jgi:hypothetical protein
VIRTAQGNTGCAFDIMKSHLKRNGRPFGALTEDGKKRSVSSYWYSHNPLNVNQRAALKKQNAMEIAKKQKPTEPPADKLRKWLPRFPLCQSPEATSSSQ